MKDQQTERKEKPQISDAAYEPQEKAAKLPKIYPNAPETEENPAEKRKGTISIGTAAAMCTACLILGLALGMVSSLNNSQPAAEMIRFSVGTLPSAESVNSQEQADTGEIAAAEEGCVYLGIAGQTVSANASDYYSHFQDVSITEGILVTAIEEKSPAAEGGLQRGDIIFRMNGKTLNSEEMLSFMLAEIQPGDNIFLRVLREGKPMEIRLIPMEKGESGEPGFTEFASLYTVW